MIDANLKSLTASCDKIDPVNQHIVGYEDKYKMLCAILTSVVHFRVYTLWDALYLVLLLLPSRCS